MIVLGKTLLVNNIDSINSGINYGRTWNVLGNNGWTNLCIDGNFKLEIE